MSARFLVLMFVVAFIAIGALSVMAEEEKAKEEFTLVGVKSCKMCHNKEATGKQFAVWSEGPHAKAFETLASEDAVAKAKELELGNPQEEPKCLVCHATAFPVMADLENLKITMEEGVSCESCHGPGSGYKSKKVKKAVQAGEIERAAVGLIEPNEKVCVTCHNEDNPFHKEFKFDEFVTKIAHPIPVAEE
jgi:hypothetical protein